MIVLVPEHVHAELSPSVSALPVTLIPYSEEGPPPERADEAVAVFRWVAGKRYESLVVDAPPVRWLHTASAGVDHVLTRRLRQRGGFTLTDSGPAFGICIGEYVLTWMLAVSHRVPELLASQTRREWAQKLTHEELSGQTVGILGLGPIGQAIAQRCRALGMTVLAFRRSDRPAENVTTIFTGPEGLKTLLTVSDWVVVATALTGETRSLLGAAEFAAMKPSARLVNVARGPVIDEQALIAALREGRIAGAVLDVFTQEPLPEESPLWDLPNAYLTPHNSPGWTVGLRRRQLELFMGNLRRFVAGEPLEGVVDIERGY
ncbi:MAG: D-2-hydroxyacid dehydrogenase [Capsulimonadales bacterium]|nr:D-2-hydroxyacid dehydrogenase [Capsulimonadales bacterium]